MSSASVVITALSINNDFLFFYLFCLGVSPSVA